jgi:hypothetical protein
MEDIENAEMGAEMEAEIEEEPEPSYHTAYVDPFPPEEDYLQEDLRSTQFYYAYDSNLEYYRPGGFAMTLRNVNIITNQLPITEEEIKKYKEFNIKFDKIIYLVDQSENPIKSLAYRINPNLEKLDEEKQEPELNKLKQQVAKIEEVLPMIKEAYGEENLIEINCFEAKDAIKQKLLNIINPFYIRVDPEDKIVVPEGDDVIPVPKGEYGIFCPVTYKE